MSTVFLSMGTVFLSIATFIFGLLVGGVWSRRKWLRHFWQGTDPDPITLDDEPTMEVESIPEQIDTMLDLLGGSSPTVLMDGKEILRWFAEHKRCPDCGATEFMGGPCGGSAQNMMCSSCHSEFNFCLPFMVERIGKPRNPTADRLRLYGIKGAS